MHLKEKTTHIIYIEKNNICDKILSETSATESADSEVLFDESEMSPLANTKPQTDASTSCEIDDRAVEVS